jgi:hypothetical protein
MEGYNIIEQGDNQYYQGKLGIIINEMFSKLKQNNMIEVNFFNEFVEDYFSKDCIYIIKMHRDDKDWKFSKFYINHLT